jgi:hypothetical protein
MKTENIIRRHLSVVLLAIALGSSGAVKSAETNLSGIIEYAFEPNPKEIKPKMYNWEIKLNAEDSTNGTYEIVQITRRLDTNRGNLSMTNVLIGLSPMSHSEIIVPNRDGMIDFNLYVGEKEPRQNMNAPGNIGQPLIFSGKGTGKGASDWIVLPGSKVDQVTPSPKGTQLSDGRLTIIQYDVTAASGERFQSDVILRRK